MSRHELAAVGSADAADGHSAIGRTETVEGVLTTELASMLAGALDHGAAELPPTHTGAPLPALWHWAAFPAFVALSGLGDDGHPKRGGFLPKLPFERRMWAAGRLWFKGQLAIGEKLVRRSEIRSVDFKTGASGQMAFVRVMHDLRGMGGGAIREEQDIVYMPIPEKFRAPKALPPLENPLFEEELVAGPVRLFRYSAATWNAHRIHYDHAYATEKESYPGLVVHGPLQATLLMEAATRHSRHAPSHFSFRGVHPVFAGAMRMQGVASESARSDGKTQALTLCTVAPEPAGSIGHQGMQAVFEWEE